jgi:hypothetical protein
VESSYHSICEKYHLKDDYFGHRTNHYSAGAIELSICLYNKIIEIRVMKKDQFILSISISKDSCAMWQPKPSIVIGRERCLEILREEYPDVFEWCLWNL